MTFIRAGGMPGWSRQQYVALDFLDARMKAYMHNFSAQKSLKNANTMCTVISTNAGKFDCQTQPRGYNCTAVRCMSVIF